MAGAGYKLFNTGDVLTAAQVNTYLQEQAVMRFATTAARTTALSGVLSEGMVTYIDATDSLEFYNGSAWVAVNTTAGDITGVTAGTGLSGGGTSGDVTLSLAVPVTEVRGGTNQTTYATGDLLYASASNTLTKRSIGTSGQVLTVSGGIPTWATPSSGGGMTSIASGSLSGSVTTVGSFSSSYTDLYLVITDVSGDTSGSLQLRINGDTTANFHVSNFMQAEVGQAFQSGQSIGTIIPTATGALNTPDNNNAVYLYIYDYNNSTVRKNYQLQAITNSGGNNATCALVAFGGYQGTSAVTSIEIRITAGSFDGGTYILYGVK